MEPRLTLDRGRAIDPRTALIRNGWYDPDSAEFASAGDARPVLEPARDVSGNEEDDIPRGARARLIPVSSR